MAIDLGGIAKGYAADELVKILRENNIKSGLINLGGNIYAYKKDKNDKPFNIGIQDVLDVEYAKEIVQVKQDN